MMRPKRNARFAIMFSRSEKRALMRLSLEKDVSASAFVRHVVRQALVSQGGPLVEATTEEPTR